MLHDGGLVASRRRYSCAPKDSVCRREQHAHRHLARVSYLRRLVLQFWSASRTQPHAAQAIEQVRAQRNRGSPTPVAARKGAAQSRFTERPFAACRYCTQQSVSGVVRCTDTHSGLDCRFKCGRIAPTAGPAACTPAPAPGCPQLVHPAPQATARPAACNPLALPKPSHSTTAFSGDTLQTCIRTTTTHCPMQAT